MTRCCLCLAGPAGGIRMVGKSETASFTGLRLGASCPPGAQLGLSARDLSSRPLGPFTWLIGLPHHEAAGFQEGRFQQVNEDRSCYSHVTWSTSAMFR